ncbi:MAG TPA: hypothetical protein VGG83_07715 [Trebonia sp.]|jgi:hypothetical protein
MLTRLLRRAAVAAAAAMALVVLATVPALAGGGPGTGGPFGLAQCGQSSSAQCTVTAGTGPAAGTPGTASPVGTTGGAGTVAAGGTAAGGCSGTVTKAFGCVPAGCTLTAQTVGCPIGVPGAAPPAGGAPALPAPGVLAQLAVKYLQLPDPVIRSSPAPGALQLTRLPVWLWVAANAWQPQSKTAQVPGEAVTATATPVLAAWAMGDGTTVTCKGPGTAYAAGDNPSAASPTCGYTYEASSAGQPGGAYKVTVTITWDITWAGAGGAGGALAPLQTVAAAQFQVAESQALNTSGG